jgi:single-stranded-DNA-specific exonuclease
LKIDGALSASGATLDLIDSLEAAGPYGSGHPQPVFALPHHALIDARGVGTDHVKLTLRSPDGGRLDGIAFRCAATELGKALLEGRGRNIHCVGTLSADQWNGSRRVQIRVLDAALAQ